MVFLKWAGTFKFSFQEPLLSLRIKENSVFHNIHPFKVEPVCSQYFRYTLSKNQGTRAVLHWNRSIIRAIILSMTLESGTEHSWSTHSELERMGGEKRRAVADTHLIRTRCQSLKGSRIALCKWRTPLAEICACAFTKDFSTNLTGLWV